MNVLNLAEKFALVDAVWTPKIIGELNGQLVKIAKAQGEFVWHAHAAEDEMFLVVRGALTIAFRDKTVEVGEGEVCIVPRGVEHKPSAVEETHLVLFEPKSTAHTGAKETPLTVDTVDWI